MKENQSDAEKDIASTLKKLEQIAEEAMRQYENRTARSDRACYLDIACKALSARANLLKETGCLPEPM